MYGFKSFGRETRVEFVPGVTALVGPNGGGKSNVVDALRWALGEGRPKELRAERWEDVLFSGSSTLPPARMAEVSLLLDNGDQAASDWPDTITVTRRYYRHGESEYLINGRVVRLKDVTDLFLDSGLGRFPYAIIGQGRVEGALLAKPKDRLEQLEESAGVSRYKVRRRETADHLREVETKLHRLDDLIAEAVAQAAAVEGRARAEERLVALEVEVEHLGRRIERTRHDLDRSRADAFGTRLAEAVRGEADAGERVAKARERLSAAEAAVKRREAERTAAAEGRRQAERERAEAERQVLRHEALRTGYDRELEETGRRLAAIAELADRPSHADQAKGPHPTEIEAARERAAQMEREMETLRSRREAWEEARESARGALAAATSEIQRLERVAARLEGRAGVLAGSGVAERRAQVSAQIADLTQVVQRLVLRERELGEARGVLKARLAEADREAAQLREAHETAMARRHALREAGDDARIGPPGVRAILEEARRGSWPGVRGTLNTLVTPRAGFEEAIRTALGSAGSEVVVDTEAAARRAVAWLKANRRGRATFLPLDILRPRRPQASDLALATRPGAVGWAVDLVDHPQDVRLAVEQVLARVLIVETLEIATRLGREHGFRYRTVTLDGQVLLAGGAIQGGSPLDDGSRRRDEVRWDAEIARLRAARDEAGRRAEAARAALSAAEEERARVREELLEERVALQRAEEARARLAEAESLATLADDLAAAEAIRDEQAARIAATGQLIAQAAAEEERLREAHREEERALAALVARAEVASALAGRDAAERARLEEERRELEARRGEVDRLLDANRAAAVTLEAALRAKTEALSRFERAERDADDALARMRPAVEDLRREVEAGEKERGRFADEVHRLREQLAAIEARWADVDPARYAGIEALPEEALGTEERRLRRLRAEMATLGPVERGSLVLYRDAIARKEALEAEARDVGGAKDELLATLEEIDQAVLVRVRETADRVETAFRQAAATLYGGGSASFRWVTEGEGGIELWVAPPGKKPATLQLLSGGEKALGGIAWLFALLAVRPAPFVVLDEVEASLDEANAHRFSRYLERVGAGAQYIVITHHKATMEAADALWGVSSDGRGESRVVSVLLEREGGRRAGGEG